MSLCISRLQSGWKGCGSAVRLVRPLLGSGLGWAVRRAGLGLSPHISPQWSLRPTSHEASTPKAIPHEGPAPQASPMCLRGSVRPTWGLSAHRGCTSRGEPLAEVLSAETLGLPLAHVAVGCTQQCCSQLCSSACRRRTSAQAWPRQEVTPAFLGTRGQA